VGATELLPEKFSTKYESAIVFGKASEVYGGEKQEALMAILRKYSSDYLDKGIQYIKNDSSKTKVIKIEIERMTGKARR
jgi:nitroimidazol reductase NimA-like FMN-containing flavoprotein (pyridoxamine 5'-phosphate oxidase superfamily)